ncbi:MAG: hypothetical protein ACRDTE_14465 [Pseudonocardiaceae bacterium]
MTGSARLRWVFADRFAHVLTDDTTDDAATLAAICGLTVPATVPVYGVPPSLDLCRSYVPLPGHPTQRGLTGMVPIEGRSLRFAVGTFQHNTQTRDAATCIRDARNARATAAASLDEGARLRATARAAWWAAAADRWAASMGERGHAESRR